MNAEGPETVAVRETARALVRAGFGRLRGERLIPRPRHAHWIRVGHDYEGDLLLGAPEFAAFEAALAAAYPLRFAASAPIGKRDFAQRFAFPLLEGAVALIAQFEEEYDASGREVSTCIDEMLLLLEADSEEAVAARVVANVVLPNRTTVRVGDVEFLSAGPWGVRGAAAAANRILPGAGREMDEALRPSFPFALNVSLLVSRRASAKDSELEAFTPRYYMAERWASAQLQASLLTLRMATGCTARNIVEVTAPPGWVRLSGLRVRRFDIPSFPFVERVAKIGPDLATPLVELNKRLVAWSSEEGRGRSLSLGIAIERFNRSFEEVPWFDQLVDLGVGLEAALLDGSEKEEISLRLRSRAASLLATPGDSAQVIYQDVKVLYGLRSAIVHGSSLTSADIHKEFAKVSVTARDPAPGVQAELCLDRMRDILRRAILARGLLADLGLWPLKGDRVDVDGRWLDDAERDRWRRSWAEALEAIGLPDAAHEAVAPSLDMGVEQQALSSHEPASFVDLDPREA